MGTIKHAFVEWDDEAQRFKIYLDRGEEDMSDTKPLRKLTVYYNDPEERRLAWDVMIHCLPEANKGDITHECFEFETRKDADRVAKQCTKSIADMAKGKPPLDGMAAQVVCMKRFKGRVPAFSLNLERGRIFGT